MEGLGVKKFCALAILLSTLLLPIVQATPSTTVGGDWKYGYTGFERIKSADGNQIVSVTEHGDWTGDFVGASEMVVSGVIHSKGFITFEGVINFDGSVLDKDGTLIIRYTGVVTSAGEIISQWVIQSGTGDLANLRGQGSFSGVGEPGDLFQYSGKIHFEPD